MVDIKYANAFSEVLEILKYIPKSDYYKIPNNMIKLFETNRNKEYSFNYDPNKTLDEQNVSKTAKIIIAILFRDYWATQEQREKILRKENYDRQKLEEEKLKKYNVDIFKNRNENLRQVEKHETNGNKKDENVQMTVYKENIFRKLINKIIKIFNKKGRK